MKIFLFIFGISLFSVFAHGQNKKSTEIPLEELNAAAIRFAESRWGNVSPAPPQPYYDPQGNIIAYGFNYAIGKDFPTDFSALPGNAENQPKQISNSRWGEGEYAHLVMGNHTDRITIFRFINSLSDDFAYRNEIQEMASKALGTPSPQLQKVYFETPMLKYYKFFGTGKSVYVRIFPPANVLTEEQFQEEYVKNFKIDEVAPKVPAEKWDYYLNDHGITKNLQTISYIPEFDLVPFLDWSFGCSPTAAAMLLEYWDNLSAISQYGHHLSNLTQYHYERMDNVQSEVDYNVSNTQAICAQWMNTNSQGETSPSIIGPAIALAANSAGCGSYFFTQSTALLPFAGPFPFMWELMKQEINQHRPWHIGVTGHSMTGVGYLENAPDSFMICHNTWNPPLDFFNYALSYRVTAIIPGGEYGSFISLLSPFGDAGYNHDGTGETFYEGNVEGISWQFEPVPGSYCTIYYSTDGGLNWTTIISNTPNDGYYAWTIPAGLTTQKARVRIELYNSSGTLIASDGSWGNFEIILGGGIDTLYSGIPLPTYGNIHKYFRFHQPYSSWGIVGARGFYSVENFKVELYSDPGFNTLLKTSNATGPVDFIAFDQHHVAGTPRGVKVYETTQIGEGKYTEFEGDANELTVGSTTNVSWTMENVVRIWDVYLTPGFYKFELEITSGTPDLNMALFQSGNGNYFKDIHEYLAHSESNIEGANETFVVNITSADYYGLAVWSPVSMISSFHLTPSIVIPGLWTGALSSEWNNPGNWASLTIPTGLDNVIIPSGTPHNPVITSQASAKTLQVMAGATLTIHDDELAVAQDIHIYGTLAMDYASSNLLCGGDIYWESGSDATITNANADMHIFGNWNFENGADVQLDMGYVHFEGTSPSFIKVDDNNSYFHNIKCSKTNSYIGFSNQSNYNLHLTGYLFLYAGSSFNSYSNRLTILDGNLENVTGGHMHFYSGTLKLNGGSFNLKPTSGDFLNHLIVNTTGPVFFFNTYNDTLIVNGLFNITHGNFDANGHVIFVKGDWINQVGPQGFSENDGKVVFTKSSGNQFCYGETFFNVAKSESTGTLRFDGSTTINGTLDLFGPALTLENLSISTLNLNNSASILTVNQGSVVTIQSLDMGNLLYGGIEINQGSVTVADLADNGFFGTFSLHGGTLDITQDGGQYVDLNGSISITGGTMTIHGGFGSSYWPFSGNAALSMTAGTLDFTSVGINVFNSPSYSLNLSILGGTIRTARDFYAYGTFTPTAGTLEMYGSSGAMMAMASGNNLHNFLINKTSGPVSCMGIALSVFNDFTLQSGSFIPPSTMYVGGDWTNNAGATAFMEGTKTVMFMGTGPSVIQSPDAFYNLQLNKSYPGSDGLTTADSMAVQINGALTLTDGTFRPGQGSSCQVAGNLLISAGAGLNGASDGVSLILGGNFSDQNTTLSSTTGFFAGNGLLTFNGSTDQEVNTVANPETYPAVTIDKAGGSLFFFSGALVTGHLNILNGAWDDGTTGLTHRFEKDFFVGSTGRWLDFSNTVLFTGPALQNFTYSGTIGGLVHPVIEKTDPAQGVVLQSNMIIVTGGELTINHGFLGINGHMARIAGNTTINAGGELRLTDDSWFLTEGLYTINVNSGGLLSALGSSGHPAYLSRLSNNYWACNINSGGTISAAYTNFLYLNYYGLNLASGSLVDDAHSFNHCSFSNGSSGGSYLKINNSQLINIYYADFPMSNLGSNCLKSVNAGTVNFIGSTGIFSGESYDNDFYNRVNWYPALDVSGLEGAVGCYGGSTGSITVFVSGGVPPYSYHWSDGSTGGSRSNLSAGVYVLTVTDNNLVVQSRSFTVSQPSSPLAMSLLSTGVACYGNSTGTVQALPGGGTAPYTYSWNTGQVGSLITGLTAGSYQVTVTDAHGCTATGSRQVLQPIAPLALSTQVGSASIDLTVSGGSIPYAYLWNTGALSEDLSGLSPGTYSVTVTDGNLCQASTSADVAQVLSAQTIAIPTGWSLFSTYMIPVNPAISAVMTPVISQVLLVKSAGGQVYWPSFGINTIGNMVLGNAYQISTTTAISLVVSGVPCVPESSPISLPLGWSLLGYLRTSPAPLPSVLGSFSSNVLLMKNSSGGIFWPLFGINQIGNMTPGQGYQIKLNTAATLTYPSNGVALGKNSDDFPVPTHYPVVRPSSGNMTLGLQVDGSGKSGVWGEVAVYGESGNLAGSGIITNGFAALTLWGDDESTPLRDGLTEGERFEIRLFDTQLGSELGWIAWTFVEGQDRYSVNQIAVAKATDLREISDNAFGLNNYPNPFRHETQVGFFLGEATHVRLDVLNSMGQVVENLADQDMEAGDHRVVFQGASHARGFYFIRIMTPSGSAIRQVEVN